MRNVIGARAAETYGAVDPARVSAHRAREDHVIPMPFDDTITVADIVLDHPECARVFSAHRIDYCCGGKVPVSEACRRQGLDPGPVLAALDAAVRDRAGFDAPPDLRALPTTALVAYITNRHHAYLREALPTLRAMAAKVARVHGARDARLGALSDTVSTLCDALLPHIDHEERVLFPALVAEGSTGHDPEVGRELSAMDAEHRGVGEALARIRSLADDFAPPSWACTTYRTLLRELEHLERDVHQHVHLENNVLTPRFTA